MAIETYGVPVDVLRHGVDDNICAVIQRVLNVRAEERVVNHHHNPMLMCYRSDFADVDQRQCRIAGTFDPYQLRFVRPYQLCNVDFDTRGECDLNPMCGSDLCKVPVCPAVYIGDRNNVRTSGKRLKDSGSRC